jgi:hypothetical protein
MERKHTNICVIESRWWNAKNTSVRAIFELLADLHTGSPHGYEYEMANSKGGFLESFKRQVNKKQYTARCHYLTISTHGSDKGLEMFNGDSISRIDLKEILKKDERRSLIGLYLDCCNFLSEDLVRHLYEGEISAWWIAGYTKKADWIESLALNFIFFNKLLTHDKSVTANPVKTIKKVASEIKKECDGLTEKLGFKIYALEEEKNGGVNELI